MRVLFVNEKLGWFGGVEQNIADTAEGLRSRGVECALAWGERTQRDPDRYAGLFSATFECREASRTEVGRPVAELASEFAADCVYTHKAPEVITRESTGRRTVRMIHDHDLCCPRRHKYFAHNQHVCEKPSGWRCWLDLAFIERDRTSPIGVGFKNLFAHQATMRRHHALDLMLVGSRFMQDELLMNGFASDRVAILPPVVRMKGPGFTPTAEEPHVLFVGQLIRGKGVDLLLEALAMTKATFGAIIVGDGNARAELEKQSDELRLTERVTFTGWVPNHELGRFYAAARLLAVPARWPEPFGMIGLEAMHHGRPIVGFDVGGIPDWLTNNQNGLLVPARDVAAYAKALERLLLDREEATRLGRAGFERVGQEFSFERYLDRLIQFLGGSAA